MQFSTLTPQHAASPFLCLGLDFSDWPQRCRKRNISYKKIESVLLPVRSIGGEYDNSMTTE
jgi:hypothetical protein